MKEINNTIVGTINEIYGYIKSAKLLSDEVSIMRDIATINANLRDFNYARALRASDDLANKNRKELAYAGYYRYPEPDMKLFSPSDKVKIRLDILRQWLIRIGGLKACNEAAETVLKGLLKESLEKYKENEGLELLERCELAQNIISSFDDNLLDKLRNRR